MAEIKKEMSGAENYQEPGMLFKATPVLIALVFLAAVAYFIFPSEADRDAQWMKKNGKDITVTPANDYADSPISINKPGCVAVVSDGKQIGACAEELPEASKRQ